MKRHEESPVIPFCTALTFFILGVALMVWPNAVIGIFPPLIGLVMIIVGVLDFAQFVVFSKKLARPKVRLLRGIINVIFGIIFLINKELSLQFLELSFGIYILASTTVVFVKAIENLQKKEPCFLNFLEVFFGVIMGLVLFLGPFTERMFWARMLGIYFFVTSLNVLKWMIKLKK